MWQLLAAIPVTLAIALWFRAIISSQLQQVDRAIRTIGRAEYSDGVTVSGRRISPTLAAAWTGCAADWRSLKNRRIAS